MRQLVFEYVTQVFDDGSVIMSGLRVDSDAGRTVSPGGGPASDHTRDTVSSSQRGSEAASQAITAGQLQDRIYDAQTVDQLTDLWREYRDMWDDDMSAFATERKNQMRGL
jgi:hypothetical protein